MYIIYNNIIKMSREPYIYVKFLADSLETNYVVIVYLILKASYQLITSRR